MVYRRGTGAPRFLLRVAAGVATTATGLCLAQDSFAMTDAGDDAAGDAALPEGDASGAGGCNTPCHVCGVCAEPPESGCDVEPGTAADGAAVAAIIVGLAAIAGTRRRARAR
jgi:hypothetical protein